MKRGLESSDLVEPHLWMEVSVDVATGMDGKTWRIEPPPYIPERRFELIGVAPYVAASAASCFEIPAQQ